MNARQTLAAAGVFDKESAAACGQQTTKKLKARQADYERMLNDPNNRSKNMSGYHKPGSLKK